MGKIHPVSRLHGQSSPPKLRIPVRSTFISHFLAFPLATSSDSSPKSTALYGEQFSFRERLAPSKRQNYPWCLGRAEAGLGWDCNLAKNLEATVAVWLAGGAYARRWH